MIDKFGGKFPEGHPMAGQRKLFAVVSDSYDLWNAIDKIWGDELRDKVRSNGGQLIVRPDSGDPLTVPVKAVAKLADRFSAPTNDKGFRVLEDCVRVIQGDGISRPNIKTILKNLLSAGFSADNLAFGMGGKLLQADINRDTMQWAMKNSWVKGHDPITGEVFERDVFKDPIDAPGKTSKKGQLALVFENGDYHTVRKEELGEREDMLKPVFRNGEMLVDTTLAEVRARADKGLARKHAKWDGIFASELETGRKAAAPGMTASGELSATSGEKQQALGA